VKPELSATERIRPWVTEALAHWRSTGQIFDWDMGLVLIGQDKTGHGENLVPSVVVQIWAAAPKRRIAWFVHFDEPWSVNQEGVALTIADAFAGIEARRQRAAAERN
jgi:hypothetical protein